MALVQSGGEQNGLRMRRRRRLLRRLPLYMLLALPANVCPYHRAGADAAREVKSDRAKCGMQAHIMITELR